jgi:hypothetical protein
MYNEVYVYCAAVKNDCLGSWKTDLGHILL